MKSANGTVVFLVKALRVHTPVTNFGRHVADVIAFDRRLGSKVGVTR